MELRTKRVQSDERPLSGVERAVATVAKWPDSDGRKMAICRPFWAKRIANLTGLKFYELTDRQSLRFYGEPDVLCNNRSVIAQVQMPLQNS